MFIDSRPSDSLRGSDGRMEVNGSFGSSGPPVRTATESNHTAAINMLLLAE